ncbi:hypothetical protein [Sporichthya polymorpha]|uniref:hypothetical protein n=1 Tax=Sporichthya polymorpha TaxID=35751 RepID=UPI00036AB060|nr:hypothetical protein [Sporichthya polymorpha]
MGDLTGQITREYEREQSYGALAVEPGDIPLSYEAIKPAWFDALARWTLTIAPSSGHSDEPPPDVQPQGASLAFIGTDGERDSTNWPR